MPSISVGLGAGDPAQFYKAAMIAAATGAAHVNQTFTGCGFAAGALAQAGQSHTYINALVSPPGKQRVFAQPVTGFCPTAKAFTP